VPIKLPVK